MRTRTIITVATVHKTNPRLTSEHGLIWDYVEDELPIYYNLPKDKAKERFFSTHDCILGKIKSIEEIQVPSLWERFKKWIGYDKAD